VVIVVFLGFLSLKNISVEDLEIVQSFVLRVGAFTMTLRDGFHDTDEVIGEHPIGCVHGESCVAFFHVCIIPYGEGFVKRFIEVFLAHPQEEEGYTHEQ
jgi:hypothetical protein